MIYTDYMNSWYAGSKPADDFEDNMNKAMSVWGFLLYIYPKEKQRKKKGDMQNNLKIRMK